MDGRWIIASNRLPFNKDPVSGKLTHSSGGLISAITGIQSAHRKIWVGAVPPGLTRQEWESQVPKENNTEYRPLFIPPEPYDAYYNRIANDVLWPSFHYESNRVKFSWKDWDTYRDINEQFAKVIAKESRDGDLVWIHDFHLMLVPLYLRKKRPKLRTGFFLHIPFPSSEIFKQLPVREEILESLLEADLVGFHDYSYLRHFNASLHAVLGIDSNLVRLQYRGRLVRLGVFPVSIDTPRFQKQSKSPAVKKAQRGIRFPQKLILGVDRLDYIKGIGLKLRAFRSLLERYPERRGKVSLLQLAVPSRVGVPEYMRLKHNIDRLVGEINGQFGTVNWVPIHYLFNSVPFEQLLALYREADILLVTSKRDGMNLVCLEYLASQDPAAPGQVLLSEFTGAISTLSHVVPINPWDTLGTADAMNDTLSRSTKERRENYRAMIKYLENYTATDWAQSFMKALEPLPSEVTVERVDIRQTDRGMAIPEGVRDKLRSGRVRLFLDFDGTLTPIVDQPDRAVLDRPTKATLRSLSRKPNVDIIVVSGRDGTFLSDQFQDLKVDLAGEHGAKFRQDKGRWRSLVHTDKSIWFPIAEQVMQDYSSRVPHSFLEKKEYAIAWHYRLSPTDFAYYQARKLEEDLELALMNLPVNVIGGKRVIEARTVEANKGTFVHWYLDSFFEETSVTVAIGDDRTDEDMFASVGEGGMGIKIGQGETRADFRIGDQAELLPFLKEVDRILS